MHCFVGWPVLSLGSIFGSFTVCLLRVWRMFRPAARQSWWPTTPAAEIFWRFTRQSALIHWVAKELFKHKLFGTVLLKLGCIPVDRKKADLTAAREIVSALRNNQIVGVFPQATRVRPDRIPYVVPHSGAIRFAIKTESPILPVGISAPFRLGGSVRIVFGKPINLRMPADSLNDADLIDGLAVDVMRKVYALVGYDYQLVDQKGGAPS